MLTYGIPPEFRGGVHYETAIRHRVSPEFIGSRNCVPMAFSLPRVRRHRASKPRGSSERVLPWQITMDQLIFASLSHTHYWYEVGMLKVPATHGSVVDEDPLNRNWNRCASLALSGIICVIVVMFDIFAGSLHRLASLYVTGVPGFHHITPRATPTTAVVPKSYVSLGSTIISYLSWGIDPTAHSPDTLLTARGDVVFTQVNIPF